MRRTASRWTVRWAAPVRPHSPHQQHLRDPRRRWKAGRRQPLLQLQHTFSLGKGEIADFAPDGTSVHTILARVTGGQSSIDGTLRCTVPAANFFLINAAGMIFGPDSALDVQGNFAVTTAAQVRLGPAAAFSATPGASDAALTAEAPSAFSFLSASPAGVTIHGAMLSVPTGGSVLIAAGSLTIDSGGGLSAPAGQIGVVTVSSPATVSFNPATLLPSSVTASAFGPASLTDDAYLSADGAGGGLIAIQCGDLTVSGGAAVLPTRWGREQAGA